METTSRAPVGGRGRRDASRPKASRSPPARSLAALAPGRRVTAAPSPRALREALRRRRSGPRAILEAALAALDAAAARRSAIFVHRSTGARARARRARSSGRGPAPLPLYGRAVRGQGQHRRRRRCRRRPPARRSPTAAERSAPRSRGSIAAGAICVGKTNLDQFATGLVGTRSPYGAPRNRVRPRYIPAARARARRSRWRAGLVSFALGTDTAGSGRVPAAFNSIVGLQADARPGLRRAASCPPCRIARLRLGVRADRRGRGGGARGGGRASTPPIRSRATRDGAARAGRAAALRRAARDPRGAIGADPATRAASRARGRATRGARRRAPRRDRLRAVRRGRRRCSTAGRGSPSATPRSASSSERPPRTWTRPCARSSSPRRRWRASTQFRAQLPAGRAAPRAPTRRSRTVDVLLAADRAVPSRPAAEVAADPIGVERARSARTPTS